MVRSTHDDFDADMKWLAGLLPLQALGEVRYTNVDYLVFSDAAAAVATGGSPFERATYRYSPLLAFPILPNSLLHPGWGKLLFSAADLLIGQFIDAVLELRGVPTRARIWCVVAWLFNPFIFTIGTRGNCEPIVCAAVLWILICLMKGHGESTTIYVMWTRAQQFLCEVDTPSLSLVSAEGFVEVSHHELKNLN